MNASCVAILFCISTTLIGFIAADSDCKVPFQPYQKSPGVCYAKISKEKCDRIQGLFLKNNCFVTVDHDFDYAGNFLCDFDEYFRPCPHRPGFCCMQSTKFECDKYAVVEYNETLGTCYAPVSGIHERTNEDVKCPEHFHYNKTARQCEAEVQAVPLPAPCDQPGSHYNGSECSSDPKPCDDGSDCEKPKDPYPNCRDVAVNCQEHKQLCTNPKHMELFIRNCARTCGYCHCGYDPAKCGVTKAPPPPPPPAPTCTDSGSNCQDLKHLCTDNRYATIMVQHCKNTCGFCECVDTNPHCNEGVQAGYCNQRHFHGLMTECRKACGWC